MPGKLNVETLVPRDIGKTMDLWKTQFEVFCGDKALYPCWQSNTDSIKRFIAEKAKQGNGILATNGGNAVGFISFDIFNFHGAQSAICHFCGNAAAMEDRQSIYLALYREMCKYCVGQGVLAHYISICANDTEVKDMLFHLGFGAYGADGFVAIEARSSCTGGFQIETALACDALAIFAIHNKSADYFMEPPICLRLESCMLERIEQKIKAGQILVAKDDGRIIGIFDVEIAEEDNIYRMYTKGCGVICGELGVHILDEYRGRGIGSQFLKAAFAHCAENNVRCAHVPWETANPYANRFWPKHFTPTMLALKRTLHPDVLL